MPNLRRVPLAQLAPVQSIKREARYLYVVREDDCNWRHKLGIAGHPLRRLSGLRAGNPRSLAIVAAYAGTDADCAYVERIALKFFKAPPDSEWVEAQLEKITDFLDAFCEGK